MANTLNNRSLLRLKGVNLLLIAIATTAKIDTPYNFEIADMGGFRTVADQKYLYASGRTRPGKIVTRADGVKKLSNHQSGNAIDIVCYKNGEISWSEDVFREVAEHLKKVAKDSYGIDLKWGGDWTTFRESPHFEL